MPKAELINAGNYAGIQTNFNKEMDAALPLDKSSAFFSGLKQQMGKIQKLSEPQPAGEAMVYPVTFEKGTLDMQIAMTDANGLITGTTPGAVESDVGRINGQRIASGVLLPVGLTASLGGVLWLLFGG